MPNNVVLKGNPYGISVVITEATDYDEIKQNVIEKFRSSETFFKGATIGISFEGDQLKDSYQLDLLNAIADNTSLDIACLIDRDEDTVAYFKDIVEAMAPEEETSEEEYRDYGTFIREDITKDNSVDTPMGAVIMGDVCEDGVVITGGDCIVLGEARGVIKAGNPDNKKAVVYAYSFDDCDLSIGGISKIKEEQPKESKFKMKKKNKSKSSDLIKAFVLANRIWIVNANEVKE